MDKIDLVLIEDDEILANVLYEAFLAEGLNVFLAKDGVLGLNAVKKKLPFFVLLDLIIPKKDGFEVLKELRKSKSTKDIPVVILTQLGSYSDIKNGRDLGAVEYIVKSKSSVEDIVKKCKKIFRN